MFAKNLKMNEIARRLLPVVLLCIILSFVLPMTVSANSAEPPSLVILVNNPPKDLSIVMISDENHPEAIVRKVAWEGYYVYYSGDMKARSEYTFKITANGASFECSLPAPLQTYNNVVTLDLSNQELVPGEYPFRSILLVSMRVALTLLIEGIVFWLFMFREKESWIIFLAINLITQGALNIWLGSEVTLMSGYAVFTLIIGEIVVFAAEMIAFPLFIKEHTKTRVLAYAFVANFISLIAGGYIISVLPV